MNLYNIQLGSLLTNCYILVFKKSLVIIDPGFYEEKLEFFFNSLFLDSNLKNNLNCINHKKYKKSYIILTHNHYDHIGGVAKLKNYFLNKKLDTEIIMNSYDYQTLNNKLFTGELLFGYDIDKFEVDVKFEETYELLVENNEKLFLFHTPGHTKGSISIIYKDILFSGDTLFRNAIGRYDLPSASYNDLMSSIKKYFSFNKNYKIYPGHGEKTRLYEEKKWLFTE